MEDSRDEIKITLHPTGAAKAKKDFFATLDAFDMYQEGMLPQDSGFTPTACSDLESQLMISKKFATKEEAEKFKTDAQNTLAQSIEGRFIQNNGAYYRAVAGIYQYD